MIELMRQSFLPGEILEKVVAEIALFWSAQLHRLQRSSPLAALTSQLAAASPPKRLSAGWVLSAFFRRVRLVVPEAADEARRAPAGRSVLALLDTARSLSCISSSPFSRLPLSFCFKLFESGVQLLYSVPK